MAEYDAYAGLLGPCDWEKIFCAASKRTAGSRNRMVFMIYFFENGKIEIFIAGNYVFESSVCEGVGDEIDN
jgi:hypothetical protein